jgi:Fic family protein
MAFLKDKPYNDLPLLPPDSMFYDTLEIYKKVTRARAALAELKGRLPVIPNPLMLINTLVLQEAQDSSTIENIVTSSDKLFRAFSSSRTTIDPATKEVLRYREALWQAYNEMKNNGGFDVNVPITIFRTVTQKDEHFRETQVYIGNAFITAYTPPEPGKILESKIDNWFSFALSNLPIDPLIKLAIMHYQFEAIHPFSDGNGRTGRILNVLYLSHNQLIDLPVLYLSKYILAYKNDYYRLLMEVTEKGNWHDWILYMLEAIEQTAVFTLKKINAIFDLFNQLRQEIETKAPDIYSYELVEVLCSQPYCKIGILVDRNIASRNTASKYLNRLAEMGILTPKQEGNENLFLNKQLYDILAKG